MAAYALNPRIPAAALLTALLLTAPAALLPSADAAHEPLLTVAEGIAIDAVLEQAVHIGFPEVRGATWFAPWRNLIDLKLPAGDWLNGCWNVKHARSRETPRISEQEVWERSMTKGGDLDKYPWDLLRVDASEALRLRQAADFSINGTLSETMPGWGWRTDPDLAIPGAVLRRLGAAALGDRLLIQARYQRTRAEYRLCFAEKDERQRIIQYETPGQRWNERLEHTLWLSYEQCDRWRAAEWQASAAFSGTMALLPFTTIVRRECHQWFRLRALEAGDAASVQRWCDAASTMLDAADRPSIAADLALVAARAAIPMRPAADASVAACLATWNLGPFSANDHQSYEMYDAYPRLSAEDIARIVDGVGETYRNEGERLLQWRCFQQLRTDPEAVVGLLGDPAPSRWLEQGTPRTVGDNALRALTMMWQVDPRILVGRDRNVPWTAEERARTAVAIQAWWAAHRGRPVLDGILSVAERLPAWSIRRLFLLGSAGERAQLVARLRVIWGSGPPAWTDRQEEDDLARLLDTATDEPLLAALVQPWPVRGSFTERLIRVHEILNDARPLDELLERLVADKPDANEADQSEHNIRFYEDAFCLALARPGPARLRLVQRALARDPGVPAFTHALAALLHLDEDGPGMRLMRWAVLWDERPLERSLVVDCLGHRTHEWGAPKNLSEPSTWAQDLRICDCALERDVGAQILQLERAQRDAQLAARRMGLETAMRNLATTLSLTHDDCTRLHLPPAASDF